MKTQIILGVAIAVSASVAQARLSEGEAAIVGGIIGYGISQMNQDRQYEPQPQYRQNNPYNVYERQPRQIHHHHYQPQQQYYRQPQQYTPHYPGVIRVYPDGTTVYSPN